MPYADKKKQKLYMQTRIKRNCDFCHTYYEGVGKRFCSNKCSSLAVSPFRGRKHTEEFKRMVSLKMTGFKHSKKTRKVMSLSKQKEKNPQWKGGISPLNALIRRTTKYKKWRSDVFARDNYTCQLCGARSAVGRTVYLEADHIKAFSAFPKLRFDINNGRTLCRECHKLTDNYKFKAKKHE